MNQAIETNALTRTFGPLTAVDNLDIQVAQGTFFGFLGPNGAGKSTTIKLLTGILSPTAGNASILGHSIQTDAVAAKACIGMVPESMHLFTRLTAPEYLRFSGMMYGMPASDITRHGKELLDLMELSAHSKKLITDYSHGMKKKLAFAAALLHNPRILFLDEPFEGIDTVSSRLLKNILNRLIEKGVTIFLTSHILEIVERLCSHIAVINQGKLVASGALKDLKHNGKNAHQDLESLFLSLVGAPEDESPELSWLG